MGSRLGYLEGRTRACVLDYHLLCIARNGIKGDVITEDGQVGGREVSHSAVKRLVGGRVDELDSARGGIA